MKLQKLNSLSKYREPTTVGWVALGVLCIASIFLIPFPVGTMITTILILREPRPDYGGLLCALFISLPYSMFLMEKYGLI